MEVGTIFTLKKGPEGNLHYNYHDHENNVYYLDAQRGTYMAYPEEYEVVDVGNDEAFKQQILTQDVLNRVTRRAPQWKPLVSGGAPRDWDVGITANDIDVWCANAPTDGGEVKRALEVMFGVRATINQVSPKGYATGEGYIEYIYSAMVAGLEFQFIFVTNNSVQAVHNHVCASLSRIHFDYHTRTLHPTLEYKGSRKQQCIIYYDDKGCSPRVSYIKKMKERYPDYRHDFEHLGDRKLARELEEL